MVALCPTESFAAGTGTNEYYSLIGSDRLRIGTTDAVSQTSYIGSETLHITHVRDVTTYNAIARYFVSDGLGGDRAQADYTVATHNDGTIVTAVDRDPRYLTVLNQPFAVQLDAKTMHDLAHLEDSVPFSFPSPLAGTPLHGVLKKIALGMIGNDRVAGVAFSASGPIHGTLPERANLALSGVIHMDGQAFYRTKDALLRKLEAELTITGTVDDGIRREPITVVYRRLLRATTKPIDVPSPSPKHPLPAIEDSPVGLPAPSGTGVPQASVSPQAAGASPMPSLPGPSPTTFAAPAPAPAAPSAVPSSISPSGSPSPVGAPAPTSGPEIAPSPLASATHRTRHRKHR